MLFVLCVPGGKSWSKGQYYQYQSLVHDVLVRSKLCELLERLLESVIRAKEYLVGGMHVSNSAILFVH